MERDGGRDGCQSEKIIVKGREFVMRVTLSTNVRGTAKTSHLDCSKQPGRCLDTGFNKNELVAGEKNL